HHARRDEPRADEDVGGAPPHRNFRHSFNPRSRVPLRPRAGHEPAAGLHHRRCLDPLCPAARTGDRRDGRVQRDLQPSARQDPADGALMALTTAATPPVAAPAEDGLERLRPTVLPIAFAAALLLLWEAFAVIGGYPKVVLPAPSDIFAALADNFSEICRQALPTIRDTLAGFALASLLGIAMAALLTSS